MSILETLTANFSVLHNRNFRIYLGGQTISLIGTWLQQTALGWVVWELTGREFDLSVATMLSSLPLLLLSPWAGAWADRFDRRKLIIFTQTGMMILAFILSALVITNSVQIWHIYVLSLLLGIFAAIDLPAVQAFMNDLTGRDEVRRAINLFISILQVSRTIGPAIAGITVSTFGAGIAFFLNGVSFLAVIVSLLIVRAIHEQARTPNGGGALSGFREAWTFVMKQPRQRDLLIFAASATFFGIAIVMSMLPAVAGDVLRGDAGTSGLLMSSSGAGALVGVLIFAPIIQSKARVGVWLSAAMMGAGIGFLILGQSTILPLSMLGLFVAGLAMPSVISTTMGMMQFSAPPAMRARVMSLFNMVSFGLQPFAALWVGWLAEQIGLQNAILFNASALIVAATIMLARTPLRRWNVMQSAPVPAPLATVSVPATALDAASGD
jgi:MFS family permease